MSKQPKVGALTNNFRQSKYMTISSNFIFGKKTETQTSSHEGVA